MFDLRVAAAALAIVTMSSPAFVQTTPSSSPPATTATSSVKSATSDVKNWTKKQWNAMKREYQKDKAKWDACSQRASDQHLTGRQSWAFLYDCMKT